MNISNERLRSLCIKHQWFAEGTCEQYDKLFYANTHGAPVEEIVTMIWLCSDAETWCRRDIKSILETEGDSSAYKHEVWCVDRGNNFNGMIDCRLFADYELAKEYYDGIGEDSYRRIYSAPDIWNYLERTWKEGETL